MNREGYKDSDFDKTLIPIHKIPPYGNPKDYVRELMMYPEFECLEFDKPLSLRKVLRYIGAMYQVDSPILEIKDLSKRKVEAAKWAGFDLSGDGKTFKKEYLSVLKNEIPMVRAAIVRMCRVQNNPLFSVITALEESLAITLDQLRDPTLPPIDRDRLRNAATNTQKDLNEKTKEFFNGDPSAYLELDLMSAMEDEQLDFKPEDIAQKRSRKERLLRYNPYGEYEPKPLTIDESRAG